MEYVAYFDHNSFEPDQFYCVTVQLEDSDLSECLSTLNQVWEVIVSTQQLPSDSFLAEVRHNGDLVWNHKSFI